MKICKEIFAAVPTTAALEQSTIYVKC